MALTNHNCSPCIINTKKKCASCVLARKQYETPCIATESMLVKFLRHHRYEDYLSTEEHF